MGIPQEQIISLNKSRKRALYWRKIGDKWVRTTLIPADPDSIAMYLARGFKAVKPEDGEIKTEVYHDGNVKCPICGFEAKDVFGLTSHLRKHIKSKRKEGKP